MTERRFTDEEIARIIGRAVEIDRRDDASPTALARGLSLSELQDVAGEVGISRDTIARAAGELERPGRGGGLDAAFFGGSPILQRVQLVDRPLGAAELAEIVRVVDEEAPDQGTVTEALGSVRWGSRGRFLNRQVTLQPTEGETRIRVQERYQDRVRAMSQIIPTAYGIAIGMGIGAEQIGGAPAAIIAGLFGAASGWTLGRAIWVQLRNSSRRRVDRISDAIAAAVGRLRSGE